MPNLHGTFHRDASQRLTFEIYELSSDCSPSLCQKLSAAFHLQPVSELVIGLDEMFRDYSNGSQTVGLEWDVWSGFIIVAKTQESEELVRQLANYLSEDS